VIVARGLGTTKALLATAGLGRFAFGPIAMAGERCYRLLAERRHRHLADRIAGIAPGGRRLLLEADRVHAVAADRAPPPVVAVAAYALLAERVARIPACRTLWVSPDRRWVFAGADRVTAPTDHRH
jgi:hypothetical protein